jgi:hypothetical protein
MEHPFWLWQVAKYTAETRAEQRETQKRPAPSTADAACQGRHPRPAVVMTASARAFRVLLSLVLIGFWAASGRSETGPKDWPHFNGRDLNGWRIVDKHFFAQRGRVEWRDGAVVLDAGKPGTAIAWTGETPRQNYELRCEAKRLDGDDFFFGLTFPVDKSHCTLILGGWGGGATGLSNIDDYSAIENETTDYVPFENGRWYRVRLRVEPSRIQAWVDDKQIVNLPAADKRFSIWWEQEPVRPLGIATWNTRAALRNLQVTRFPEPPQRRESAKPNAPSTPTSATDLDFFERRIRPVLAERCYSCHSAQIPVPKGGLRLDQRAAIVKGGDSGPAINLDRHESSLLLAAIRYSGTISEMPPDGKLPANVIADFDRWIERGAVFPGPAAAIGPNTTVDGESGTANPTPRGIDIATGRSFWSFQPLASQQLPGSLEPTTNGSNPTQSRLARNRIDPFVLQDVIAHGLVPAAEAPPRTLLRRLSFDLLGLPPSPAELDEARSADAPDQYQRWLDRYLASPRYGERWGRHWLDIARYAEDHPTSEATCVAPRFPFRYRDWVIRAWNEDIPYDDQVRRQLAADLMDLRSKSPEQLAALGFLGLSPVYHKEPKLAADVIATIVADEWDERLDTVTRGFLGLTVACARCHDHKFDPIRTEDYYALAGVMASTQPVEWPLESAPREAAEALTEVQRQIVDTQLRLDYAKKHRDTAKREGQDTASHEAAVAVVDAELKRLKAISLYPGPIANAVRDAGLWLNGSDPAWTYLEFRPGQPRDLPVFIRGNANRHGPIIPRRFLEVLSRSTVPLPFPSAASGRRELAEAIVTDAGPLAARVIVNRVWAWHFGEGLVRTTSNFGQLGERPSHPALMDDLAHRFVAHGWSLKWLHREILTSHTWRQAAVAGANDPENRWLAGMRRRRLEPEAWRDSVLALSEQLDHSQFGPSGKLDDPAFHRRTIYGTVSRQKPASLFKLFDFPDAKQHSERRVPTTTPLQHLYLLNSDFIHVAAVRLATLGLEANSDADRVDWLFHRILQRAPTGTERAEALDLIANASEDTRWPLLAHALLATTEFLYVE